MTSQAEGNTAVIEKDMELANGKVLAQNRAEAEYTNLTIMTSATRFNQWTYDFIRPYLGKNVLEVGSGFGTFTSKMLADGMKVTGLDVNGVHMARGQKENPKAAYHLHDISQGLGPLKGHTFDTMVSLNVFEHIEDDQTAMKNVAEILQPGGKAVLLVPAHPIVYGRLDDLAGHWRRYTKATSRQLIEQSGLKLVALEWFNPWSLPAMFMKTRIQRADRLSMSSVQSYDRLVPLFRKLEKVVPRFTGQSLLIVGQK